MTLTLAATAMGREGQVQPVPIPAELAKARQACHNPATVESCLRGKLRTAYRDLSWQQKARTHDARRSKTYGVMHALRIASALYGVPLADMRAVSNCESHLNPLAKNRSSTATGLFQWLDGSWRTQGLPGFDRTDPYASALAAGRAVTRDHGWSQWVCKP